MENKKTNKLLTIPKLIIIILAVLAGVGLNLGRTYSQKGSLDTTDYIISGVSLLFIIGIIIGVLIYANLPKKSE